MTTQRSTKQAIRSRMQQTGEPYKTARQHLLQVTQTPTLHDLLNEDEYHQFITNLKITETPQGLTIQPNSGMHVIASLTGQGKSTFLLALVNAFNPKKAALLTSDDELNPDTQIAVYSPSWIHNNSVEMLQEIASTHPDVLFYDELRNDSDFTILQKLVQAGTTVILTIHAADEENAVRRLQYLFHPDNAERTQQLKRTLKTVTFRTRTPGPYKIFITKTSAIAFQEDDKIQLFSQQSIVAKAAKTYHAIQPERSAASGTDDTAFIQFQSASIKGADSTGIIYEGDNLAYGKIDFMNGASREEIVQQLREIADFYEQGYTP